MSKLYFMNNGAFDVRAMLTFGVSAKGSDNAIGYFGTGFKYAVAIILRLGGSISIESCGDIFKFEAKKETIRDKEFQIVYVNDREAGFTTRLGINWQPWMAFRELYCNAIDEGGEVSEKKESHDTIITVACEEISQAYRQRDIYFINSIPKIQTDNIDIHEGHKPFIYYKGIAVTKCPESVFSYNIKSHMDLTEDRTAAYTFQYVDRIKEALQGLTDKTLLNSVLSNHDKFESNICFSTEYKTSNEFFEICSYLEKTDKGLNQNAKDHVEKINKSNGVYYSFELSQLQSKMLDKAKEFLKGIHINVDDFEIKTVTGLGHGVMGRALNGVIYLSEIPFQMGTKQVASTLIEEWLHNKIGCKDFDRQMQSWLFDKILSITEEKNGEPL